MKENEIKKQKQNINVDLFSTLNLSCYLSDQKHTESRNCCRMVLSATVFILDQNLVSSANIFNSFLIQSINRAHSFPRAAEFRAETQNLPFSTEF